MTATPTRRPGLLQQPGEGTQQPRETGVIPEGGEYRLNPNVKQRLTELYIDGEKPILQRPNGDVPAAQGSLLDPLDIFKWKKDIINDLISTDGFVESYDPTTKKFGNLSGWHRNFDLISDDEIVKAVGARANNARSIRLRGELEQLDKAGIKYNSLTSDTEILSKTQELDDVSKQMTKLLDNPKGQAELDAFVKRNGRQPTSKELQTLNTKVYPESNKGKLEQSKLDTEQTQREVSEGTLDVAEQNANTSQYTAVQAAKQNEFNNNTNRMSVNNQSIQLRNEQALAQAEIVYKNKLAEYEHNIATRKMTQEAAQANLDRELRKDLAVLGIEEKSRDRAFDRQESDRDRRQMMILQLMKGLGNLGNNMAL